jgi:diacylglycerol O-acyltransferase / wax synthase
MERLSGLDASFLYGETPETPTHTAPLWIFEPAPEGKSPFESFRKHIKARLHLLPFFHRKLVLSPIQLDHPVWIDDDDIDLDYHIRQMALPKPGSDQQLRTLVSRLHMILLDRTRPLWQFYVIEGLQGGRFAVYAKLHHAAVDGGAGMVIMETIFSSSPEPSDVPTPQPKKKEAPPNLFELISTSYANFFRQQQEFFESWPNISKAIATVSQRLVEDMGKRPELPTLAPRTIFNTTVSSQRSFGTCTISLTETKEIGKALGAKLNDVVMGLSAGALRRYLKSRDALPPESLITAVPVSLREPGNTDINNQVTTMLCRLATDVADPIERLRAVQASSKESKALLSETKDVMPRDISWLGAPIIMTALARMSGQANLPEALPPIVNVLISNVPGPRNEKYCVGAKLLHVYPVSAIGHGLALNITLISYLDQLDFGLIACRATVPDIEKLADHIIDEFEELKRALEHRHIKAETPHKSRRTKREQPSSAANVIR